MLLPYLEKLPEGYSEGLYKGVKYGITKTTFNQGRSYKIYGEELGGNDFVSLNYYLTAQNELLKPCEMPEEKVIDFLKNLKLL
jgi:hypothetical protein